MRRIDAENRRATRARARCRPSPPIAAKCRRIRRRAELHPRPCRARARDRSTRPLVRPSGPTTRCRPARSGSSSGSSVIVGVLGGMYLDSRFGTDAVADAAVPRCSAWSPGFRGVLRAVGRAERAAAAEEGGRPWLAAHPPHRAPQLRASRSCSSIAGALTQPQHDRARAGDRRRPDLRSTSTCCASLIVKWTAEAARGKTGARAVPDAAEDGRR